MSQYHLIANLDRREYLDPDAFGFGRQLCSLDGGDGAMFALALLTAASNGKGTGDFRISTGQPHTDHPVARHVIGRWAGERIAVVGDYYDPADGDPPLDGIDKGAYRLMRGQEDGWTDISEHVAAVLDLNDNVRERRHEVHVAASGARYSHADGFDVDRALPGAPRSLLDEATGTITPIPAMPPVDPRTEPVHADPLSDPDHQSELRGLLMDATSMFGRVTDDAIDRVELAAEHPTQRTWSDASSIILHGGTGTTLWQAVGYVEPDFPASAQRNDVNETVWERVPSGRTVLEAVRLAVRLADDEDLQRRVREHGQRRLAEVLNAHQPARTEPPVGKPSRRRYSAMGDDKLRSCIMELRGGYGDAYHRCVAAGGDPRADLERAEQAARDRGLNA